MPLIANNVIINGKIVEPESPEIIEIGQMNEVPDLIFDKKKSGKESQYIKDMLSIDNE